MTEEAEGVLTVPNRAFHFEPPAAARTAGAAPATNRGTVWTQGSEGRIIPIEVLTGTSDENRTEVIAGDLREGQPVIVGVAKPKGQP